MEILIYKNIIIFMKDIFLQGEGDNYFERNKSKDLASHDFILDTLELKDEKVILEIGCSNGWRLNALYKKDNNRSYFGFDPSSKAIEDGIKNNPNLHLWVGTCDKIDMADKSCDIILVPFVFMYIQRDLLLKSVCEIDRILKDNGRLVISDFYPNKPKPNKYKHIEGENYIFKQEYFKIFLSTQNYYLDKLISCIYHFNSSNNTNIYDDLCFYVELKKDLQYIF